MIAAAFRGLRDGDRELLALAGWERLNAGQIAAVLEQRVSGRRPEGAVGIRVGSLRA